MDLISTLSSTLGIDPNQAQALAGTVLGAARSQVADDAGGEALAQLDKAVPELGSWKAQADAQARDPEVGEGTVEESGGLFSMLSQAAGSQAGQALAGAIGGKQAQDTTAIIGVMGKLGLKPTHAAMAAPVVLDFLEERLPGEWLDRVLGAAPILMGLKQQAPEPAADSSLAGQALGALGKLF